MSADTAFEVGRLYQPIKAIAEAMSAARAKIFLELPGIIAWWPCGPGGGTGWAEGTVGNRSLQPNGNHKFGYDGNPYLDLPGGSGNYMVASGFPACLGSESWIDASLQGLTIGGWFYPDSLGSTNVGLISKQGGSADEGYLINTRNLGARFAIGVTPTTLMITPYRTGMANFTWSFVVGRFIPSTEICCFVDGSKGLISSGVPAAIVDAVQGFEVGRYDNNNARVFNGRCRDLFICQSALSDDLIEEIRQTSLP